MPSLFGPISHVQEGNCFENRITLSQSGVHSPVRSGISGSVSEGANSIVLSGGYEDNEDFGDTIIYTGQGGRSHTTGEQVADQTLTRGNRALAISCERSLPVRVIRGPNEASPYAPKEGYRYDGLYTITEYWKAVGKRGFTVWKFRLVKI